VKCDCYDCVEGVRCWSSSLSSSLFRWFVLFRFLLKYFPLNAPALLLFPDVWCFTMWWLLFLWFNFACESLCAWRRFVVWVYFLLRIIPKVRCVKSMPREKHVDVGNESHAHGNYWDREEKTEPTSLATPTSNHWDWLTFLFFIGAAPSVCFRGPPLDSLSCEKNLQLFFCAMVVSSCTCQSAVPWSVDLFYFRPNVPSVEEFISERWYQSQKRKIAALTHKMCTFLKSQNTKVFFAGGNERVLLTCCRLKTRFPCLCFFNCVTKRFLFYFLFCFGSLFVHVGKKNYATS